MAELTKSEQQILDILREQYWPYQQPKLPIQAVVAKFPNAKEDVTEFNVAFSGLLDKGYLSKEGIQVVLTAKGLGKIGATPPSRATDET